MKREIAKKWVRALRSKKYKQAKHVLKTETKNGNVSHCCLGVLCELYQQEQKKVKKKILQTAGFTRGTVSEYQVPADNLVYEFEDCTVALPLKVMRWAGLHDDAGYFRKGFSVMGRDNSFESLSGMNDSGCRFSTIADVIEQYPEEL